MWSNKSNVGVLFLIFWCFSLLIMFFLPFLLGTYMDSSGDDSCYLAVSGPWFRWWWWFLSAWSHMDNGFSSRLPGQNSWTPLSPICSSGFSLIGPPSSYEHHLVCLLLSMLLLLMVMLLRPEHLRLCQRLLLASFLTMKVTDVIFRCDLYHIVPCKLSMHILKYSVLSIA
jgi:hypothetical protein